MQIHQHIDAEGGNTLRGGGIVQAINALKMIKGSLQALAQGAAVLGAPTKAKGLDPGFVVRL